MEQTLRKLVRSKTMEKLYLEGRNFGRLVKNRTIEKFTALMWYLAGSNFGRFVRNRTIEKFTALMLYLGSNTSDVL